MFVAIYGVKNITTYVALLCFLLSTFHVEVLGKFGSEYTITRKVKTPFANSKELLEFINTKLFFDRYINITGGSNVTYLPHLNPFRDQLVPPQSIEYITTPDIPFIPSFMLKPLQVRHNWQKYKAGLLGNVITSMISFDIEISTLIQDIQPRQGGMRTHAATMVYLILVCTIKKKLSVVPHKTVDVILDQFIHVFFEIINEYMCIHPDYE